MLSRVLMNRAWIADIVEKESDGFGERRPQRRPGVGSAISLHVGTARWHRPHGPEARRAMRRAMGTQ